MNILVCLVFAAAASLEVGGDAVIRRGLLTRSAAWIILGCLMLAVYGIAVTSIKWDFGRLMGVYVGFFALASVLYGRFVFREQVPVATWCGLALIVIGGLVIQLGRK
jgi:drug/metabolite transporter superfamily protein YnfA